MIRAAALLLLWGAAIYRVAVTSRTRPAVWRTSFTVAMTTVPVATTLFFFRAELDAWWGVPNLAGMASRVVFAAGAAALNVYLEALVRQAPRRRVVGVHVGLGGLAGLVMAGAWVVSPVHDAELADLAPLSGSPAVAAYHATFYAYMIVTLVHLGWFCARQTWTQRQAAAARALSLTLIGLACLTGLPVMLLFLLSAGQAALGGAPDPRLGAVGNALLPWPLMLLAAGVLALLAVPWCTEVLMLARTAAVLRPLWAELTGRHPQVRLALPLPRLAVRQRLRLREQRMVTEIHDALRHELVALPERAGAAALGRALRQRGEHPTCPTRRVSASAVLAPTAAQADDLAQLVVVAQAFSQAPPDQRTIQPLTS